ncbi:MAG: diguanylate cyclase [Sandaracinaceae bacterium]|nr:diguanylate cyclase [Sandaracinaceae bacterium]
MMSEAPIRVSSIQALLGLQREVVAGLLRSEAFATGDAEGALRQITEAAARLLSVDRASVWRFNETRTSIECLDLYDAVNKAHEKGLVLHAKDAPQYFEAATQERVISADDARTDPRTSEFRDGYLVPLGITSMLDAPIVVRSQLVGVVCNEHVGPARVWRPYEELVAGTLADFVGMALSAAEHTAQARELAIMHEGLEKLVEERTRQLVATQESVRTLFEASPVALVLTRLRDQQVILGNQHASELFGVVIDEVRGVSAASFWVRPEERTEILTKLLQAGRDAEVEVELIKSSGQVFWGAVSAAMLTFEGEKALLVGVRDITEKKQAAETLRKSEEALRTLLEAAPTPLVVSGLDDGVVRFGNKRAADMFSLTVDQIRGRRAIDFYGDADERRRFVELLRKQGHVDDFAARLKTDTGEFFWALLSARTMTLQGERVFTVGFADLTEQKEIEHQLRDLATLDSLTGVYNRRHFFDMADRAVQSMEQKKKPLCVAMFDADHFKKINDRFGHDVGDDALRMLTSVCQKEIRATDTFARFGGEEFVLLLPETPIATAAVIVERIRRAISEATVQVDEQRVPLTLSVGLAERKPGELLDTLLRRSDEAVYEAKRAGRNCVVLARDEVRGRSDMPRVTS